MNIRQFRDIMHQHVEQRGCGYVNGKCDRCDGSGAKKLKRDDLWWWGVTLRSGITFNGIIECKDCENDDETIRLYDRNGMITIILVDEIVAIGAIESQFKELSQQIMPGGDGLTSLRKGVGRLYGIIKDMEAGAGANGAGAGK